VALFKRRKWLILVGIAVVIVACLAATRLPGRGEAESKAKTGAPPEAVMVTTDTVTQRGVRRTISAVGSLWGWEEVPITPKVEGRVVRVYKFVGDTVKPGDVLLEIDPTDFELAVAEAQRGLELDLARLNLSVIPTADFKIAGLPSVVRAEAIEKQAKAKVNRLRASPRGSVTEEELQQADTEVEVARSNIRQAELEARATLASVRQREAMLKTAQQRLADTRIVAPAPNPPSDPGVPAATEYSIAFRKATVGETVRIVPLTDAPPLFRLVIDRPLKLQVTLAERHLSEVKIGQPVELEVEAYPGETFRGTIARVNRSVDRSSRTFTVEVVVPNEDRRLSAGSFVKATIVTKTNDRAITVPEEAIVNFAGVTKVFVVDGDKVREVQLKIGVPMIITEGQRKRTWIEVEGNLPAGSKVATSGQARLADGVTVRSR
jgi:RND family efflux transporter MFP subunit